MIEEILNGRKILSHLYGSMYWYASNSCLATASPQKEKHRQKYSRVVDIKMTTMTISKILNIALAQFRPHNDDFINAHSFGSISND